MFEKIIIFGLGSLGSVIAARLKKEGYEVYGKVRNTKKKKRKIKIIGEDKVEVEIPIFDNAKNIGENDLLILSVQPYQTLSAVAEIRKKSNPKTIIHILNGVKTHCYSLQLFQKATVIGGGAWWSATMIKEDTVFWSKKGRQVLGKLKGNKEIEKKAIEIISQAIPIQTTENPWYDLYNKLILNLVNAIFTLTGQYYPIGLVSPEIRELTVKSLEEGKAILEKMHVPIEEQINRYLEFLKLPENEFIQKMREFPEVQRGDPHIVSSYRSYQIHNYSGASWLSNEVIELGEQLNIKTPYTKTIVKILNEKEKQNLLPLPPHKALELVKKEVENRLIK